MEIPKRPDFIHHQNINVSLVREAVFGIEDGMVSTLGALIGIAAGTQNIQITLLSGLVVIAVESISMGVGSFISNKSQKETEARMLYEETEEIRENPKEEKEELAEMFEKDGWPLDLARQMAETASHDSSLMLKEMAFRELKIIPDGNESPLKNGLTMWAAYIIGGCIPLISYFFLPIQTAMLTSVCITLAGLFALGAGTTRYTKRGWIKAGAEMLVLAAAAALTGYIIGQIGQYLIR